MGALTRIILAAVFFLLFLVSGIWLSRSGRPLNPGISAVHKLFGVAGGVFLIVSVYQLNRAIPLDALAWVSVVVTGLCFLGLVASGGILSGEQPLPAFVLRIHQVAPVLAAASTAWMLYLLLGRS